MCDSFLIQCIENRQISVVYWGWGGTKIIIVGEEMIARA